MSLLNVRVKKLHPHAVIPEYAKDGDAGMDLTAVDLIKNTSWELWFSTGLAIEIPEGYVGLIYPRSSISKTSLTLANSVGVIDSGYRGEIQVRFHKLNFSIDMDYEVGDRIAQMIIMPYPHVNLIESDELSETVRAEGGFGSTDN